MTAALPPQAHAVGLARIPFTRGLTFRQAATTVTVVMALGFLGSVAELFIQWRDVRAETLAHLHQVSNLIRGSAAEAAYQLNPELSRRVVDGLLGDETVERAVLRDNFGRVLAEQARERRTEGLSARLGPALFGDLARQSLTLDHALSGQTQENVGRLEITLAPAVIAKRVLDVAAINWMLFLIRDTVISLLMVFIFYFIITRPLVRLSQAISRVDPERPGEWPAPRFPSHERNELGLLVQTVDRLLKAFQRGLQQRDKAQGELLLLTQELEKRVDDRTRELQVTVAALAAEKAELARAHGELAKANRLVVESIQYARRIQHAMLPDKRALGDAVRDLHVWWEPLHVVGGDYFWLERFGSKSLLILADCTGHGVPGAFITLVAASALDRILHESQERQPSAILKALDAMVRTRLRQDRPDAASDDGLDAAVCLWDTETRQLTFAGAGLPLLYCAGGEVREIRGDRASLGYSAPVRQAAFTDHVIDVEPGTAFYLLTDGVPDHMGGQPRRLLGRRRLASLIAANVHRPMEEQIACLQQALESYRDGEPRRDDTTLLGFVPL
ncbi:MAG TPA: SpoIIE family protein phosphatase [Rhodocyclaceae bacterium]|nr:SpoIIE family protein phosphatase [Rhodocyclaceae bacterium]